MSAMKTALDARRSCGLAATLLALTLLLGATAADAKDRCIRDSIGDVTVFKRFKTPRPGDCQPLHGYTHHKLCTLHGTVCGSSNGQSLRYGFDYVCAPLPSSGPTFYTFARGQTGGIGSSCDTDAGGGPWGCGSYSVFEVDCPSPSSFP